MTAIDNNLVIRGIDLGKGVILAPMAGISDSPVRRLAKKFGADLVCSEMMSAKGLAMVKRKTALKRIMSYTAHTPEEKPFSVQLFGHEPETFTKAAGMVAEAGADIVDINAGCPVKKVVSSGSGASIMRNPKLFAQIVKATRAAGDFPLTVKMRLGWDQDEINYLEIAKIAVEEGADAVTLHARTRAQMFSGLADWGDIRKLVQAVKVPVIGNGDIKNGADAVRMFRETGCAGIMIGRGATGRPWIFRNIQNALDGLPDGAGASPAIVQDIFREHFEMLIEAKGEKAATLEIRKHILWYSKAMPGAVALRRILYRFDEPKTVLKVAEDFFENAQKHWNEAVEKQLSTQPVIGDSSLESLVAPRLKELVNKTDCEGGHCLYDLVIHAIERPLIQNVLEKTRGNQIKAAEVLGINRNTLRKKIQLLGIDVRKIKGKTPQTKGDRYTMW